ncbi:MAG: UvrD-helicase domain-containing protein [Vulcanococcus sp.]
MTLPPFEPNGMPLSPGIRLLEASAGTGKTFALAHLVLRLVSEGPKPLAIDQLLVVTFTDAAAAELRDRIARRLQQALDLLEAAAGAGATGSPAASPSTLDQPLAEWLAAQGPAPPAQRRGQLLLALEQLDRADITTIHGFCRRTLQRQALEAGLGPAVALETRAAERRGQIVHDYWQQQVLPLPAGHLAGLLGRGIDPARLAGVLQALDGDPALELDPLPPPLSLEQPLAPQLERLWQASWQRFQELWQRDAEALEQNLAASAAAAKEHSNPYRPYRLKAKPDKLNAVNGWLAGLAEAPAYQAVLAVKELQEYFHPGPVQKLESAALRDDARLPQAELLQAIADLVDGPAELLLLQFAHWGRSELARRRQRSGEMGYGQLLEQLDPGDQGSTPLLQAVADRYRAALIDEFQDTDPIQWRILRGAFAAEPARHLLVMVGDPKQAIYRFRGGELATYRLAAEQAEARYGLVENRRSSEGLIAGLNALMQPGLVRSQLPVPPVLCRARGEALELEPHEHPLQLLPLEPLQLEAQVAAFCQGLLERGLALHQGDGQRGLEPGDLCLLVNRHREAEALRVALERRGLPSRLVSQGDVFATEGALALQRLLDALAAPGDPGRLRLLAASTLLGWSAERIAGAAPETWDGLAHSLGRLVERLPQQGLTALVGELLGGEALARLALRGRALADLQQAAELVQEQMHRQGLTAAAAADWLRHLRLEEERELPEEHRCRSDAAESAIAVVTVHRSKGLEYPVVICPYLWKGPAPPRAGRGRLGRRWRPADRDRPRLDLHLNPHWGPGRAAAEQDHQAELQEAERRAYVACTRARHLLVLGWPGPQQGEAGNPLSSWLLEPGQGELRPLPLQQLTPAAGQTKGARWRPGPAQGELELGPTPQRPLDSHWGRASYSAWTHAGAPLPPEAGEDGRDSDALSTDAIPEPDPPAPHAAEPCWPPLGPLAHFPRGAGPGDALHRILEQIDYPALATGGSEPFRPLVERQLERAGLEAALADGVLNGLQLLVHTPFGGPLGSCRLADLPAGGWLNELSFDLPLAVEGRRLVRSSGLAAAFRQHPGGRFAGAYARSLEQLQVASRGFLTGSIDLVFRWQQRWWVADWKSNWLGQRDAGGAVQRCGPLDYTPEVMAALMESNHYPLQAHLYLVALHRYLRWRLPGYAPQQNLGGYAYVFLRGVPGAATSPGAAMEAVPGMLVEQPPLQRVLALDALLREGQP